MIVDSKPCYKYLHVFGCTANSRFFSLPYPRPPCLFVLVFFFAVAVDQRRQANPQHRVLHHQVHVLHSGQQDEPVDNQEGSRPHRLQGEPVGPSSGVAFPFLSSYSLTHVLYGEVPNNSDRQSFEFPGLFPRPSRPSPSQVDCKSGFDSTQCDAASVNGSVSYPIDWTVGTGAVMNENWCPMTLNTADDECPSERFRECDPFVSKEDNMGVTKNIGYFIYSV